MNKRLKYLRKHLGLNQSEMADKMKLSQTHISALENGTKKITDRLLYDICREFNVSEQWLRIGEGEMFVQQETFSLDEMAQKYKLSQLEIDIVRGYMELPPATRKDLIAMFDKLYGKQSETAATTIENEIDAELESYRLELEAEQKGIISLASERRKGKFG